MKTTTALKFCISIFLMVEVVVLISGCGTDPQPQSNQEMALKKLTAKSWTVKTVTVDGVDKTIDFVGLGLNFTSAGFTAVNGKLIWPAADAWTFTDDSATAFIRGDQVIVRIVELSETTLKIELTWRTTTFGGGRINSLSGVYLFVFE